jgi:hypothetical protein
MVDWLLENSLGRIAKSMRAGRLGASVDEGGHDGGLPFYVPGAASLDPVAAPRRVRDLKVLDPACGTGHFLAGAFDLLVVLYREEARDEGRAIGDADIARSILENNLFGLDIDARAVQVAAAVLYVKAKRLSPTVGVPPMNVVASTFDLEALALDDLAPDPSEGNASSGGVAWRELYEVGVRGALLDFDAPDGQGQRSAEALAAFLDGRMGTEDLGVRFDGEALGAGRRLRRLLAEQRYDVVAFNPPYLATSKIDLPAADLERAFGGAPDIFGAFVHRAFELCKPEGLIAFVALSNWMFLSTYRSVRERVLGGQIIALVDLGKGAFRHASKLIQTAMVVAAPDRLRDDVSLGGRVGSRDAIRAAEVSDLVAALKRPDTYRAFDPEFFTTIEGAPLLFWLEPALLRRYGSLPKVGEFAKGAGGIATTNNDRFLRAVWEVEPEAAQAARAGAEDAEYLPYLKGAEGREWLEPFRWMIRSRTSALELRLLAPGIRLERPQELGVAYTTIGQRFRARLHTVESVRDVSGASFFPTARVSGAELVAALNRSDVRELASAFNPTVNFQLGDVRRLPFIRVEGAEEIALRLRESFDDFERGCELSVDYEGPRGSTWEAAQAWAQLAVDRVEGTPLPPLDLIQSETAPLTRRISHALGLALGRFGEDEALDGGLLVLDPWGGSLVHPDWAPLVDLCGQTAGAPDNHAQATAAYLRTSFFEEHKRYYEGRPIYLPLCSAKKSFVAYVWIHRCGASLLGRLLDEHLLPARARLSSPGRLSDELDDFIAKVRALAEHGPPPVDGGTRPRERDAPLALCIDDGVLVNSAALWPLLEPMWKDPKRLWKQIANAHGKKDFDWTALSRRYFPARVRKKCESDPSLAFAHGCLWELHPALAYAWELRLSVEHGSGFTIEEPGSADARARFLEGSSGEAREIGRAEARRRGRRPKVAGSAA